MPRSSIVVLAALLFLAGCGADPTTTETLGDPEVGATTSSDAVPPSTTRATLVIDCSTAVDPDSIGTLRELIPEHQRGEFTVLYEFFAATEEIGDAAREEFERVSDAIDALEPLPPVDREADERATIARLSHFLDTLSAPDIPQLATRFASSVEQACGANESSTALRQIALHSRILQTPPTPGYCDALAEWELDAPELQAIAPAGHRPWFDLIDQLDPEDDFQDLLAERNFASSYLVAQCGADVADLVNG